MRSTGVRLSITQVLFMVVTFFVFTSFAFAAQQSQSGSAGIEGTIPAGPPTNAATISLPRSGQNFTSLPITVSGICRKDLLVEVFDNNVFVGSTTCVSGSYSLQVDLFSGQNDLVTRVYDALNQAGPDSNLVTVFFNSAIAPGASRPNLTTAYARRGADPDASLTWPITLSGGAGPYAISIDWGDHSPLDLISRQNSGIFNIEHVYSNSGIYNITVKVTDVNGSAAFLQLVGVSNGPLQQNTTVNKNSSSGGTKTVKVVLWWPFGVSFGVTLIAFWLGKQHQLETIRSRLRRGERPI
jgi:hypothetical protein